MSLQTARVTNIHECSTLSVTPTMTSLQCHISRLLFEIPLESSDLYRISPALDISTDPLARRTCQTAGPVRASTFYLSLARTGHLDICRATTFQIVVARTMIMTNHSMYFSRRRPSHISAVFALSFCYSEMPA